MNRRARIVAATLSIAALGACGPKHDAAFARALSNGDRAATAGRHLEAAERYEQAARTASRPRDRDYALSLAASSFARAQDRADANRVYGELASRPGEHAARARYERAVLVLDTDEAAGLRALEEFVLSDPNSALARRALALVLERGTKSPDQRLALLERTLGRVRKTELEERVRYEIAIAYEQKGDADRAVHELDALVNDFPYPKGNLFDDALFRAAEIEERRERYAEAMAHLERMLRERETTEIVGSYERPKYLPAAEKIAGIYRDKIRDLKRARDAYERIFDTFEHSVRRDDAMFEAVLLSRRLGDESAACSAMAKITRKVPESRYVPCARKVCPSASANERPCADYIVRKIEKGTTN